jgi:type II secretory pathway component PulF
MFQSQISLSQLIRFCHRVGMGLRSGLAARRIWEGEAKRGSGRQREVMEEIYRRVCDGDTIVEAMKDSRFFPKLTVAMVEIGELTGRMEAAFMRLAEHYENEQAMRRQFISGITWPAIQFFFATGLLGLVIWVMGLIAGSESQPIDIIGLGLTGFSGMVIYFTNVGLVYFLIGFSVYALLKGWFGPAPVKMAMHLPVIGPCFEQLAMGRLCWSLGMALDAGLDAIRSVELAIESTQNPFYLSRVEPVKLAIAERGTEFYEAFRDADGFPVDFLDMLEAAEISGTMSESLVRMSHNYDEEARRSMRTLTMVCTGGIWLLVTGFLIFLIFRLASFYIGMINNVMNGTF